MEMNQFSAGDRIICKYSDATDWIYRFRREDSHLKERK